MSARRLFMRWSRGDVSGLDNDLLVIGSCAIRTGLHGVVHITPLEGVLDLTYVKNDSCGERNYTYVNIAII